jgi:outer membrane protein OmpA-like peptidoglycan-associated protein
MRKIGVTLAFVTVVVFSLTRLLAARQEAEGWDFVPGEKLLLYDDYTDMPKGAAPPHWKVRGSALRLVDGRLAVGPGQATEMFPNIVKWPNNFTIEMDIATTTKGVDDPASERTFTWTFEGGGSWVWYVRLAVNGEGSCKLGLEISASGDTENAACKFLPDKPNKWAIWVQDGRIRFYVNADRVMDLNQVKAGFQTASLRLDGSPLPVSLGPFRIAESAPDVSKSLFSSGRYVSHGILFDVDSDAIRSESRPVLQQIAEALTGQPSVKLRIEGHTDSTGDAARNLDLSRRRAASVKNALVKQFGIAADRLTTDGFGDTKPVATNDTPQGRAENRRVEFVKQ